MRQFIYILTDTNRKDFKIGLTDDLNYTMQYYKSRQSLGLNGHKEATRLVYFEEVREDKALTRLDEIDTYTRPQKERLIRFDNANWHDLSIHMDMQCLSSHGYDRLTYAS